MISFASKGLTVPVCCSYGGGTERTWTPTSTSTPSSMGSNAHSSGQTSHAPLKVHFGTGNKVIKSENSLIIRPATAVVVRPNASFLRYNNSYIHCGFYICLKSITFFSVSVMRKREVHKRARQSNHLSKNRAVRIIPSIQTTSLQLTTSQGTYPHLQ